MAFENLAKVTGFNADKIKEHLLILNSLVEKHSCSKDEQTSLMFLLGALTITESYLMGLEAKIDMMPPPAGTLQITGSEPHKCRSCGAEIVWRQTPTGRWCPFDLGGESQSHFKTCPQASRWSNNKKQDAK